MTIVLALQGSMAVGKTTAAQYVQKMLPEVHVSYENPRPMIEEINKRNLNKDVLEDYVEIQKIFIKAEIERWKTFEEHDLVLTDLGAEEIEFYTLFYPIAKEFNWNIEERLSQELEALRACKIDKMLFLDASRDVLIKNKTQDVNRRRGFFDFYVDNLLENKRRWFKVKENVEFLDCNHFTEEAQCHFIYNWVKGHYMQTQDDSFFSVIVPYDTDWPMNFTKIKAVIEPVVEDYITSIEHVGSTSIPGMFAKPIIDIVIAMKPHMTIEVIANALSQLGYKHVGDQGIEGREVFKLVSAKSHTLTNITHHLYVCPYDSMEMTKQMLFKTRLINDDKLRNQYIKIKLEILSRVGSNNRSGYVEMKQNEYSDFFADVLA